MKIIRLIQETPGQGPWTRFWHPHPATSAHSNPRRVLRRQTPAAAMPWLAAAGCGASELTRGLLLGPIPVPCFDLPGRGIMEVTVPAAGAGSGVLMELRRSNREGGPNDSRFSRAVDKWSARVSGLAFSA